MDVILLVLSLVCFVCAAMNVSSRINLTAAGLALLVLSYLL